MKKLVDTCEICISFSLVLLYCVQWLLKKSRVTHSTISCKTKNNLMTWTPAFSRAWCRLLGFTLSSHWLLVMFSLVFWLAYSKLFWVLVVRHSICVIIYSKYFSASSTSQRRLWFIRRCNLASIVWFLHQAILKKTTQKGPTRLI